MTPHSGLGQLLILIGYSSGLPEMAEARRFKTVVLSCTLQKKNHTAILAFMHSTAGLNTDGPVSRKVSD